MRAEVLSRRGRGLPVLYVPGIDGTGELLLGTASRLSAEFDLLRVAYESGGPPDSYEGLARSIADCCRAEGFESCLVIAESFGGAVALQLALDHPDLVRGLMIVNSFAYFPSRANLGCSRLLTALIPRFAFDLGRRWFAPQALFGRRKDPEALEAFRKLDGAFFDADYRRRLTMIAGLDLRPRLGELALPVALFWGDQDRIVPSNRTMTELRNGLPDATAEVLPGAGHLILPLAEEPWVRRVADLAKRAAL